MEKKYKLIEETPNLKFKTLYRIEALKDFDNVKKGDKGGFIENEENLSQYGDCWIYDDAKVYDNAEVSDNAEVYGITWVFDNAQVYGNAVVRGHCCVADNAKVCGNTIVCDDVLVCDNAKVCGKAEVFGHAAICGGAVITNNSDYIVFKNWWSSGRYFTWTRSNNMWKVACFHGTGKELIEKAYKDSEISGREYERVVKYVESIIADDGKDK